MAQTWLREKMAASEWSFVTKELLGRLIAILRLKTLVYFLLVGGVGAIGTWGTMFAMGHHKATAREVILSAATYSIALSATACADTMLDKTANAALRLLILLFSIAAVAPVSLVILDMVISSQDPETVSTSAVLFYIGVPFIVWAIANARDEKFATEAWDLPAGGSPTRGLEDR